MTEMNTFTTFHYMNSNYDKISNKGANSNTIKVKKINIIFEITDNFYVNR